MNKLILRWTIVSVALGSMVAISEEKKAIANTLASEHADYTFLITADWRNCSQISAAYQEVYAFETANFYINICQKDNLYFYSGEAKQGDHSSIFIPAYPLENDRSFQATNGNVSYLVLVPFTNQISSQADSLEPAEAILTIKRNEQLISVESSLNKYCHRSETAIAFDNLELQLENSHRVATITQKQDIGLDLLSTSHDGRIAHPSGNRLLPAEIFHSNSRFDFYRVGGKLHRLTTCN